MHVGMAASDPGISRILGGDGSFAVIGIGGTRPSIGFGWELEVVTMVVLGGVSILGGSGSIPGVVIAAFVMGMVTFGLGLLNVPGIVMSIVIGALLIGVIALPRLWSKLRWGA